MLCIRFFIKSNAFRNIRVFNLRKSPSTLLKDQHSIRKKIKTVHIIFLSGILLLTIDSMKCDVLELENGASNIHIIFYFSWHSKMNTVHGFIKRKANLLVISVQFKRYFLNRPNRNIEITFLCKLALTGENIFFRQILSAHLASKPFHCSTHISFYY